MFLRSTLSEKVPWAETASIYYALGFTILVAEKTVLYVWLLMRTATDQAIAF